MKTALDKLPRAIQITKPVSTDFAKILTPDALRFIAKLARIYEPKRQELLRRRVEKQREIDQGKLPDFLPETKNIRESSWKVAPIPDDLLDRRVEITGPVERKMMINALNSGARIFMADFEDATSPTWENIIQGQVNLCDMINRTIRFENPDGKVYTLNDKIATTVVRPRGWHLVEKHILVDDHPISASLFDFGLYFFHNAKSLIKNGTGPYFYLPKLESHLEARLWNDIFTMAQKELNIPKGTIKATVLIENILAAFEMDEILYELRDHAAGLNCGRWDYIFSYIKKLRNHEDFILPDRTQVTMTVPFMRAYSLLCIQTCHHRQVLAIGGMAPQIPVKNNPEVNQQAIDKVCEDKEREARDGHDGTWVAHPGLVSIAMKAFDQVMPENNQVHKQIKNLNTTPKDLLRVPDGTITEQGLRTNINVGIRYIEAWLRGYGAVGINHLMEDAATAEISRAQVWQWIRHSKGILDDGRPITRELFRKILNEELEILLKGLGIEDYKKGKFEEAHHLFSDLVIKDEFVDFLTLPGYEHL